MPPNFILFFKYDRFLGSLSVITIPIDFSTFKISHWYIPIEFSKFQYFLKIDPMLDHWFSPPL